jgi:hypothetical protein
MSKQNEPAFPETYTYIDNVGILHTEYRPGMTLRDWFAGQALIGYLSNNQLSLMDGALMNPGKAAEWSYDQANSMLSERSK